MTVAPAAILRLDNSLASRTDRPRSYVFLGVVGDAEHSFGYHLSPNQLRANGLPDDYSLVLPRDQAGAVKYPDDASAWDLGFSPGDMIDVTTRLITAAEAKDPRMSPVREFCGTTNGTSPHPFDLSRNFDDPNNTMGWDGSHVTHVHISFYRDVCNDYNALAGILGVICGDTTTTPTEDGMSITFHQYDKDPTPGRNKQAVYLVTVVDGVGVSQQWMNSRAELADRQARAGAAGNKNTTVQHPLHTRDYYGPVIGDDPEKATP